MINTRNFKWAVLAVLVICAVQMPSVARSEENLALYGLKGYAYTHSPLASDGLHLQTGAMYSIYHENNLRGRDGYIWACPVSLTYGDGNWWELALASHWEYWKNTDFDVEERGMGDFFIGGKFRFLGQDRGNYVDVAVMPYAMLPNDDRDEAIGDLYLYNPTDDSDEIVGINLLIGRRWDRFYLAGNIGVNRMDSDLDYIENTTAFFGLTMEYQISETWCTYLEFINSEHKNRLSFPADSPFYDSDRDRDIRELGAGLVWLKNKWAFKLQAGRGFTETSPDLRALFLVNRLIMY